MKYTYRLLLLAFIITLTSCVSSPSSTTIAGSDEDKDIGIGGTGMLAADDSGIGGTGVLGEVTGFGSVFVNGIEIEYDEETPFTINGEVARHVPLEVGDVVEVLTTDGQEHTTAMRINLRHEVIGVVQSIDPGSSSFTVLGQSIVQAFDDRALPEVGSRVAVSGFRIDEKTILSTRVTAALSEQEMLRTSTELPYADTARRWIVQTHLKDNQVTFSYAGSDHQIRSNSNEKLTVTDILGIKILKVVKSDQGRLKLSAVINPVEMPRGRKTSQPDASDRRFMMPGKVPGGNPGHNAIPGASSGFPLGGSSGQHRNSQPGLNQNMNAK